MDIIIGLLAAALGFLYVQNCKLKNQIEKPVEKAKRTLSDVKKRMLFERLTEEGSFDGIITSVEELEELEEIEADRYAFMERQSRFYLECALGLMAHSYENLDDAKRDAAGIFELSFDEDIVQKYKKKDPGAGGDLESIQ
ncbi:hypothetical protein P10VF_067 [Rhizobium phage vB_RleM_P10VF]|uniref:Uncharacterized protein n=1 Tax=Rhizobium phage vB_RleM_P10VF TaxID=1527770 RepID=A0A076YLS5_9CAUD|nr:hypothetical protein P10VF_067 [Rhizobium phage vB_RleM_P10VF]AIK68280.1 hypothetical protein P10VF_067 [Rhizobium phage vB_RleM_P10VF]